MVYTPQPMRPGGGCAATWPFHDVFSGGIPDCSFQMNSPDIPSMTRVSVCSISEQVGMSIFG